MGIFITVTIVHYPIILAVWNTDDDRYSNFAKIRVVIIVITHNASRTVSRYYGKFVIICIPHCIGRLC